MMQVHKVLTSKTLEGQAMIARRMMVRCGFYADNRWWYSRGKWAHWWRKVTCKDCLRTRDDSA